MGPDNSTESKEGLVSVPLKEVLIQAAHSPNLAIPEGITRIDLGPFGEEAELLLDRTLGDPRGRERGRSVITTHDGRVLIGTRDYVGKKRRLVNVSRLTSRLSKY